MLRYILSETVLVDYKFIYDIIYIGKYICVIFRGIRLRY